MVLHIQLLSLVPTGFHLTTSWLGIPLCQLQLGVYPFDLCPIEPTVIQAYFIEKLNALHMLWPVTTQDLWNRFPRNLVI